MVMALTSTLLPWLTECVKQAKEGFVLEDAAAKKWVGTKGIIFYRDLGKGNPTYRKPRSIGPKTSPRASSPNQIASVVPVTCKRCF